MIHRIDHRLLYQLFQLLQVKDHAGQRVGFAFQRHFQDVVMPMPAGIRCGSIKLCDFAPASSAGCAHTCDAENSARRVSQHDPLM